MQLVISLPAHGSFKASFASRKLSSVFFLWLLIMSDAMFVA